MTTPFLTCQRCGAFGPTMADLQQLCRSHWPVVDRVPCRVEALDKDGNVLGYLVTPPGTVRLGCEPMPVGLPTGFKPEPVMLANPQPAALCRQQEFLTGLAASPPPRFFVGYSGRPMDDEVVRDDGRRAGRMAELVEQARPEPGPVNEPLDEHGIDRAAFASFSADGYRCSRCQATGKTLEGMVAACTCAPALLARPTEAIPGRPFAPFMTTPPAPEEETVGFSVKMPDRPAPWGPLKIQFQAVDAAGNALASVPAGEQLDTPPGAVGFRYLIDRVEGGDELVVSPSVGFRAAPGIVAEPEDDPDDSANLIIPGVPMTLPTSAAYLRAPCGSAEVPAEAVTVNISYRAAAPAHEEDEGAPPPSPEHEAALRLPVTSDVEEDRPPRPTSVFTEEMLAAGRAALVPLEGLVTLEMRVTRDDHDGHLLFHGSDGELLEAAADGVPHAVPVGTDHVKMIVRRKA